MQSPEDPRVARHRRPLHTTGRHRRTEQLKAAGRRTRGSAVVLVLLIASAAPSSMAGSSAPRPVDVAATLAERERAAATASRSQPRTDPAADLPTAQEPTEEPAEAEPEEEEEEPEAEAEPEAEEEEPEPPEVPAPVGDLSERQMEHATTIVRIGQELDLPEQGYVVALATALQESYLRVLASPVYPESFDLPHDDYASDHDSVGIFQQRPSTGWGTVAECMDPEESTRKFYSALQEVPGWEDMPITVAAQTVQVSAFPDYYAKHEPLAHELVATITGQ